MQGHYSPYPVRDPTAGERAVVAGRVYRAVLDEWARWAVTTPRPGRRAAGCRGPIRLELIERLGPWSLPLAGSGGQRGEEPGRPLPVLGGSPRPDDVPWKQGRFRRETGPAKRRGAGRTAAASRLGRGRAVLPADRRVGNRPDRSDALPSERPLNPVGVAVGPAEQAEIAGRVYRAILDEAVNRFLASPRDGERRREEVAMFDARLAERLGFWSDLWRQSQDVADRDVPSRSARGPCSGGQDTIRGTGRAHVADPVAHRADA